MTDRGQDRVAGVILRELLPLESIAQALKMLNEKNWRIFFYRLTAVGLFLVALSIFVIILVVFLLHPIIESNGLIERILTILTNITLIGILFVIFAAVVSRLHTDITEAEELHTPLKTNRLILYRVAGTLASYLLFWTVLKFRIIIVHFQVFKPELSIIENVGRFFALIIMDTFYFGGLLAGIGIIGLIWLTEASELKE